MAEFETANYRYDMTQEMATTEAQRRATKKYLARQKNVMVRMDKEKEQDMITWLERKESMQAYIKGLIRADMQAEQTEKGE